MISIISSDKAITKWNKTFKNFSGVTTDVLAKNKKLYVFALAVSYLKLVQNDLIVIFYLCKNCFYIF